MYTKWKKINNYKSSLSYTYRHSLWHQPHILICIQTILCKYQYCVYDYKCNNIINDIVPNQILFIIFIDYMRKYDMYSRLTLKLLVWENDLEFLIFLPSLSSGIKLIVQHYILFICYRILYQILPMHLENIDSTEIHLKSHGACFLYVETLLEFSFISETKIKLCTT